MRPTLRFLDDQLIIRIISEAKQILSTLGVTIHNKKILTLLADSGADVDFEKEKVLINDSLIDKAVALTPNSFFVYDINGEIACDYSGDNINFTPGSSSIYTLDYDTIHPRRATSADYVDYCKVVSGLKYIGAQATAMVPSDVHESISDSYRLYLSLMACEKPVVTGAFTIKSFEIMKDFQLAIRGTGENLRAKPLTVFSCCPTSPLSWSDVTSQNLIDCGRYGIPVELIAMPMAGFIAPVTLVGTLIQHTAENLSGLVIAQIANPGAPILFGGSPGIFDIRYETTPMGAVETMMIDCAYSEIGKFLRLPTQAYIALSDSKLLDAQAGIETSMGATLAALSGINGISGPGMHDYENSFSLEKLVVDNEICGIVYRMIKGIEPKEDFPSIGHFQELLKEKHLLISKHTRKYLKEEHHFPGGVIERASQDRWQAEGSKTINEKAHEEVIRLIAEYCPSSLPDEIKNELTRLMAAESAKFTDKPLPDLNL
ncbi:MAG: trimethylamine methyltransferase family protein [Candidatus Zixiibacteriota bacterium]